MVFPNLLGRPKLRRRQSEYQAVQTARPSSTRLRSVSRLGLENLSVGKHFSKTFQKGFGILSKILQLRKKLKIFQLSTMKIDYKLTQNRLWNWLKWLKIDYENWLNAWESWPTMDPGAPQKDQKTICKTTFCDNATTSSKYLIKPGVYWSFWGHFPKRGQKGIKYH